MRKMLKLCKRGKVMQKMSSNNNNEVISIAKPHTVKKFELIERYTEEWLHKLLNISLCEKIIFIDCMCNSGEYRDVNDKSVMGTGIRVAKLLHDASFKYPSKDIFVFLNDIDKRKTDHIKNLLPMNTNNFKLYISTQDANDLLKRIGPELMKARNIHTLLVYDPYKADIDWEAVMPFFNMWSEVIINHMVSDSIRTVAVAKKPETIRKYEKTYQTDFANLIPYGNDRNAYEKQIENIIAKMRVNNSREFYIAAFPFFNRTNSVVYNLIHFTNNQKGFSLFKKVAWQTFGGKSSAKDTHGNENQLKLDLWNGGAPKTVVDEDCFYIKDIADYIQSKFEGQKNVPLSQIWAMLEEHPIFPSEGFRHDIKNALKINCDAVSVGRTAMSFAGRRIGNEKS